MELTQNVLAGLALACALGCLFFSLRSGGKQ